MAVLGSEVAFVEYCAGGVKVRFEGNGKTNADLDDLQEKLRQFGVAARYAIRAKRAEIEGKKQGDETGNDV